MMADGENFEDWCAFVCGSSEKRNLPTMSAPQLSTVCPDGERSATLATWAAAALLPWPRPRGHLGGSPQGKRRCGAAPAAHGARLPAADGPCWPGTPKSTGVSMGAGSTTGDCAESASCNASRSSRRWIYRIRSIIYIYIGTGTMMIHFASYIYIYIYSQRLLGRPFNH